MGKTISRGIVKISESRFYVALRRNKVLIDIGKFDSLDEAILARDNFLEENPPASQGKWAKENMTVNNHNILSMFRKIVRTEVRYCERCNKDLLHATHYEWCVHHRDHDKTNNCLSNFELLCKSCHQEEHISRDNGGQFA